MPEARQGEIWWAVLPGPAARRPVLVLTRSPAIPALSNVTVAPLTRRSRGIPAEVELSPSDGVPTSCVVSLENILTVQKTVLDRAIATLDGSRMNSVFAAIRYVFAMPR